MSKKQNDPLITQSPCIGICSTTYGDEVCLGCNRTAREVIDWNALSDEQKHQINQRLCQETTE